MEAIRGEALCAGAERDGDVADLNMPFRRLAEQGVKLAGAQAEQLAQRAGQQGEGVQRRGRGKQHLGLRRVRRNQGEQGVQPHDEAARLPEM